jgi:hypothetical protein
MIGIGMEMRGTEGREEEREIGIDVRIEISEENH